MDNGASATIEVKYADFTENLIYLKEILLSLGLCFPIILFTFFSAGLNLFAYFAIDEIEENTRRRLLKIVFFIPYYLGSALWNLRPREGWERAYSSDHEWIGYYDSEKGIYRDKMGRPLFPEKHDK